MLAVILKEPADNILRLGFFPLGDGVGIDPLEHERAQRVHRLRDLRAHAEHARLLRVVDHVGHERADALGVRRAEDVGNFARDVVFR